MSKVNTAGRTDIDDFFRLTEVCTSHYLHHYPFLVFVPDEHGVNVQIVHSAKELLNNYDDDRKVMAQWKGNWNSDFFQFTVRDVRRYCTPKPLETEPKPTGLNEPFLKVRLNTDLTRYHPALANGTIGILDRHKVSKKGGVYYVVTFPGAGEWDILPQSLDALDEDYLKHEREKIDNETEAVLHGTSITLITGPKGGFRNLTYFTDSGNQHHTIDDRRRAYELIDLCKSKGIQVSTVVGR